MVTVVKILNAIAAGDNMLISYYFNNCASSLIYEE